jgi:hypothetical protein
MITTSQGKKSKQIRDLARQALDVTISDDHRREQLDLSSYKVDKMLSFIYGYTLIDDGTVCPDDEIINWTFVDVSDDLNAAIWNTSTGFYKAAASCLRNALEMGMASLYFQVRENLYPLVGGGYNRIFAEWDSGNRNTPNWGEMRSVIDTLNTIKSFNSSYDCNVTLEIYDYFQYLCNFTHGRPYSDTDKLPTNSINMGANTPELDLFNRLTDLTERVIAWICAI